MAGGAEPAAAAERVVLLDALRGMALLGVFLANMFSFSGWLMLPEAQQVAMAGPVAREVTAALFEVLVDGKFYTIFSTLFGLGFALQMARLERRGDRAAARFRRRLLGLLAIGLFHLVFVWFGDILTLYALAGFVLLAARRWSDRTLLRTATVLILLPLPGAALLHVTGVPADFGFTALSDRVFQAIGGAPPPPTAAWMRRPDWTSFAAWQGGSAVWRVGSLLHTWRPAKVVAIMLIGLWAGRRLLDGTLFADRTRLWRVLRWGLIFGLPGNLLYAAGGDLEGAYGTEVIVAELGYALGVVPLGLAYAAAFALAWPHARRVLGVFAAPGRMALTNYLAQSIVSVTLFHGIGLGLAGRLTPGQFVPLAVAIFAGQALFSRWWLARFDQGPAERLWRRMTYGAPTLRQA